LILASESAWELDKIGALAGLLILVLMFSLLSPSFRQSGNLMLIVMDAATVGIVAVGQTVVLLTGGIDLSVGSIVALTGLVAAGLMKYGIGPIPPLSGSLSYVAMGVALALGAALGAAQGWLISNRRMPPFIVTLGTMVGLKGLALGYSYVSANGSTIYSLPRDFKWISNGYVGPIPVQVLIMVAVYGLAWYTLRNTKLGRYCYAIGSNETAARLSGVNVDRYKTYVYALSGFLAALSGLILVARIDSAIYTNGEGYELSSTAAAIIGGTSLHGGVGGVVGTLIGVLIIKTVPDGMLMLDAPFWWRDVVTGGIILLAVLIDVERQRARKAAANAGVSRPVITGHYLNEVLTDLAHLVEERLGCRQCRVYLVDRETGDLVPQEPYGADGANLALLGRNSIAAEAKETGQYVYVPDIGRDDNRRVVPLHPQAQSALALPLSVRNRVVGVIEAQSPVPDAFSDEAAELLASLGNSTAVMLEDAWLLENGWLVRHTRDALRHLWDDPYLGRSALAEWALSAYDMLLEHAPAARGETLRQLLLTTVEGLRPLAGDTRDASRSGRGHRILHLTYVEGRVVDEITRELHISRRQYFYDQKEALETLADVLVRDHQAKLQERADQHFK
jgi:ribose/xylose/arabinose/galactoside ABC-type transport system permease subunit/putative methionine-R-sulfoxide reductase with GAF domain